jgi:SOS response regulatory protein OraA/RecX
MKEWCRWETMADDFAKANDHHREAECLEMALDILPPGRPEDAGRLRVRLDDARTRAVEQGERLDQEVPDQLVEAREVLAPEDAKEAIVRTLETRCTSLEGVPEAEVLSHVLAETGLEEVVVTEALEDLIDEGRAYRTRPGQLMMDGVVDEQDVEMAVLAVLGELSSGGRGGSRQQIVDVLAGRGFAEDDIEEAIDDLEESGRIDEGHPGQVRHALDIEEIEEVHHQVLAAIDDLDPDGKGVLDARLERELTSRGLELPEVREALEELVDGGELLRDGGEVRMARPAMDDAAALALLTEVLRALSEDRGRPVSVVTALRAARSRGMKVTSFHRALEGLVDGGQVWRDDRGLHIEGPGPVDEGSVDQVLLHAIRELSATHGMGASRVEVLDLAMAEGLGEAEAREVLADLIDAGRVHDTGDGFLRPG